MRYSTFLLASSLALHVSDADATAGAAENVNDPNRAHTFLEIKNGTPYDDERMFPSPSEKASSQDIFRFVAGKAENVLETEKTLPQAPQKSLQVIFDEILARAVGPSEIDKFNDVLKTMATKEMKRVVEVFTSQNEFLVDKFIKYWGIEAVATALVKAKYSGDKNIKTNGKTLLDDLVGSLDKTAKGNYQNVFNRLELNVQDREFVGFIDGRVDLLDDLIKYHHDGQTDDQALFGTLKIGFNGNRNLAGFIGLAAAKSMTAQRFETRFIKYLANDRSIDTSDIILKLDLNSIGYELFQRREFDMVKEFLRLRGVPKSKIPRIMLEALYIANHESEQALAMMLTKGAINGDSTSGIYERLFFRYLNDRGFNRKNIWSIFDRQTRETSAIAKKFIVRYKFVASAGPASSE